MKIKFFSKKLEEADKNLTIVITQCPACNKESGGEVCMHCGEGLYPERLTLIRLLHSIPDVFLDIERGLFYTISKFATHPGREIKRYFAGDRSRHLKPLKFILLIGGFYTFLFVKFNIHGRITQDASAEALDRFSLQWNSAILLFQFPLIAIVTWILYRKRKYTYGEHLVANAYIIGEVNLYNIVLFPVYYFFNGTIGVDILQIIYIAFIVAYYTFAFYDWFYNKNTRRGFFVSLGFVFILFIIVMMITYEFQIILYNMFTDLGWA